MSVEDFGKLKKNLQDIRSFKEDDTQIELQATSDIKNLGYARKQIWHVYDRSSIDFAKTFYDLFPENFRKDFDRFNDNPLTAYIKNTLTDNYYNNSYSGNDSKKFVAVEFGGPGRKLFRDFDGFFDQTIGVCYTDMGQGTEDEDFKRTDEEDNHSVLEGDILDFTKSGTYSKLSEKLNGQGVDFIISRMVGGLDHIQIKPPILLDRVIREWYSILNEGGIMLIQFENRIQEKVDAASFTSKTLVRVYNWSHEIMARFPEITIVIDQDHKTLRLNKNKGAPASLPPAKEMGL